ncbi:MAG: hypothetical protein QOJ92_1197 [Frankiales bacterium]|nr:hypothetical protein [Frankiales bacterium]
MPYQRGAGMDETQAHGMALEVAHESGHATRVQREGHFFTVTVELPTGVSCCGTRKTGGGCAPGSRTPSEANGRAGPGGSGRPRGAVDQLTLTAASSTRNDVCSEASSVPVNFKVIVWPA